MGVRKKSFLCNNVLKLLSYSAVRKKRGKSKFCYKFHKLSMRKFYVVDEEKKNYFLRGNISSFLVDIIQSITMRSAQAQSRPKYSHFLLVLKTRSYYMNKFLTFDFCFNDSSSFWWFNWARWLLTTIEGVKF